MRFLIVPGACQRGSIVTVSFPIAFWYFGFWSLHDYTVETKGEAGISSLASELLEGVLRVCEGCEKELRQGL